MNGFAEESLQVGAAALGVVVVAMAGGAAELGEGLFSGGRERAVGAAVHPGFVLGRFLDDDRADHAGVDGAAIFGAETGW